MVESASTFRQDVVAGAWAVLDAFKVANPTLLVATEKVRPESYPDTPMAFLDLRPEVITFDSGLWVRQMDLGIVVVDRLTVNDETMTRMDIVVDGLAVAFAATNGRLSQFSVWSRMTVADVTEAIGTSKFQAVRIGFPDLSIQGGHT